MANFTPPTSPFTTIAVPQTIGRNPYDMFDVVGSVKPPFLDVTEQPVVESVSIPLLEVTKTFTFTEGDNLTALGAAHVDRGYTFVGASLINVLGNAVIDRTYTASTFQIESSRVLTGQLWPRY